MDNHSDLDLDAALKAVLKEAYKDEVPDIIRNADFPVNWTDVKADLLARLGDGSYTPRHPHIVEVPKSQLATRPIAVLQLADRIVYEAVMAKLRDTIDSETFEEVYSARLVKDSKGRTQFPDQAQAWIGFQAAGRALADRYQNVCMLTTDITSYFEFIDTDLLIDELRTVPGIDVIKVNLLKRLLNGLSEGSDLNGVPQGPDVSSFLGNFYLRPLDAILRRLGVRFIRYQDDIKVFAEEKYLLRRAIHQLTPVVRGRHLNLSTAKTEILDGPDVLAHFEDSRKDALAYRVRIGDETVSEDLRVMFDEAVSGVKINERDVRFAVYRMDSDDYAVDWILDNLADVPYLSAILVGYLSAHSESHPDIEARVVEFLRDETRNISPYVEMQLIRMLATAPELSEESHAALWDILYNPASAGMSRQFAARAIARHVRPADLELLKGLFHQNKTDLPLRRALLVALKEGGDAGKSFLDSVAHGDPTLAHTCRFLRADPKLPAP